MKISLMEGDTYNPWGSSYGTFIPHWLRKRSMSWHAKLVWMMLSWYAGREGNAFPHVLTISEELQLGERTVKRALSELVDEGLIRIRYRQKEGKSSLYEFLATKDAIEEITHKHCTELGGLEALGPFDDTPGLIGPTPRPNRPHPQAQWAPHIREIKRSKSNRSKSVAGRSSTSPADTDPSSSIEELSPHPTPLDLNRENVMTDQNKIPPKDELEIAPPYHKPQDASYDALEADAWSAKAATQLRLRQANAAAEKASLKTKEAQARKQARRDAKNRAKSDETVKSYNEDGFEAETRKSSPSWALFRYWQMEYAKAFPEAPLPKTWSGKEAGQIKALLDRYDPDQAEVAVRYLIQNWEAIRLRYFKGVGGKPSFGLLLSCSSSLFSEASSWDIHAATIAEYKSFGGDYDERPEELEQRYRKAKSELEALQLDRKS